MEDSNDGKDDKNSSNSNSPNSNKSKSPNRSSDGKKNSKSPDGAKPKQSETVRNDTTNRSENKSPKTDKKKVCDADMANAGNEDACNSLTKPSSVLIVTNLSENIFSGKEDKIRFESMFRQFDGDAQFQYLKTFHRARVSFESIPAASAAHDALDGKEWLGEKMRCYYAQITPVGIKGVGGVEDADGHLKVPARTKQYLISPPASPPPEWEVIPEREPAINYELIAAIQAMGPSKSYEVHAGNTQHPAIVVHLSEDPEGYEQRPAKIKQTKRPDSKPNT